MIKFLRDTARNMRKDSNKHPPKTKTNKVIKSATATPDFDKVVGLDLEENSIMNLKQEMYKQCDHVTWEQILVCSETILEDHKSLEDLSLPKDANISLVIQDGP